MHNHPRRIDTMANRVSDILNFYLLWNTVIDIAEDHWEFALAHSSFLIPGLFITVSEISVWLRYWYYLYWLSASFPFLPFYIVQQLQAWKATLIPALVQKDIYAFWFLSTRSHSQFKFRDGKEAGSFLSGSNRCQCSRWLDSLSQCPISTHRNVR